MLLFTVMIIVVLGLSGAEAVQPSILAKRLTEQRWQRVRQHGPQVTPEVTIWEVYGEGSFRWRFSADYAESHIGAWAVSEVSPERGVMFLAGTSKEQRPPSRFHVLSVEFLEAGVRLGEELYQGVPLTHREGVPHVSRAEHAAVTTDQRARFFPLWRSLTASTWQSVAAPPPGDPDVYAFDRDGQYTAYFATTRCQYAGTWSLFTSGGETGELRFSVPGHRCDPRGPRDAFIREMPITLQDHKLFLAQTVYEPRPQEEVR